MATLREHQFRQASRRTAIFMDKAAKFIAGLLLALFVAISPAKAVVESVAPLYSNGYTTADLANWDSACQANGCLPGGTCAAYNKLFPDPFSAVGSGFLFCGAFLTSNNNFTGNGIWRIYPACPVPSINPSVPYSYIAAKSMCERTVQETCPIPEFPDINDSDACTKSLEKGAGKDVDKECGDLDPEMVKQENCLAKKIRDLGIGYTEPSATIRTVAYQQHFVDLWKWHKRIENEQAAWSDVEKQECAPMVAKVEAEWGKHDLVGTPSNGGPNAPHVLRKAVDINKSIPKAMGAAVNKTTFLVPFPTYCLFCLPVYSVYIGDVQDYVNSPLVNPPACKLRWGGRFKGKNFDPVHFDLFLK